MATTSGPHAVHGMGRELAGPDWPPLDGRRAARHLGRRDPGGLGRQPVVTWRSPRPMSAAALVRRRRRGRLRQAPPPRSAPPPNSRLSTLSPITCAPAPNPFRPCSAWRTITGLTGSGPCLRRGDAATRLTRSRTAWTCTGRRSAGRRTHSLGHAHAAGAALARLRPGRGGLRPGGPPGRGADELLPGHLCRRPTRRGDQAGLRGPPWPLTWPGAAGQATSRTSWLR